VLVFDTYFRKRQAPSLVSLTGSMLPEFWCILTATTGRYILASTHSSHSLLPARALLSLVRRVVHLLASKSVPCLASD
jgi:hypothetical protein